MNLFNQMQQALLNLTTAKLRSLLAVLGILVGTAAVVALMSCGQLATEKALEQFKALGINLLSISMYQQNQQNKEESGAGINHHLNLNFWRHLPEKIAEIEQIAPYNTGFQNVSFRGKSLQTSIIGADDRLASVIRISLQEGYFISYLHAFEHFCVIGQRLARQMQDIEPGNPIGKQLRIGNNLFKVIGVANSWVENGFFNEDVNEAIIIPIAAMALISKDTLITSAVVKLKPNISIDQTIEKIKVILSQEAPTYGLFIRSAKQIVESMESQGRIFSMLLAIIGGISLLVGGIGVMNVMLVAVTERKKEIGIRKAVGARNKDIQLLFLVESILLSLVGGTLGIIIGLIFTYVVAYFSHWPFLFFLTPPLAGFAVSAATGIFFGFYPAKRAAQLHPIECLR